MKSVGDMVKVCTRCRTEQPLTNYSAGKGYVGGRRSWCKSCCRETNSAHKTSAAYRAQQSAALSTRRATDPAFREKQRLKMKAWREKNADKVCAANIAKYGITLEEFEMLFEAQNGCCAICDLELVAVGGPMRNEKAHVDHDHATGHVRGLLCMTCNVLLGAAKDSRDVLNRAIAYLEVNEPGG